MHRAHQIQVFLIIFVLLVSFMNCAYAIEDANQIFSDGDAYLYTDMTVEMNARTKGPCEEIVVSSMYLQRVNKASSNVFTWKGSRLQPGCFPLSFRNAAKELCWSKSKFEQKLHKLADVGCISISLVSKSTLVRIIDWAENWPSQDSTVPESSPTCPDNQPATVPLSGTDIENKKKKEDRILCPP
mgnify:CR=1 FL=1